jgi:hypothetical protein
MIAIDPKSDSTGARSFFGRVALTLAMLWLAAGALYKLFEGSPNDLPLVVRELSPLASLDTMRVVIGIELAVIGLVIAVPRIGWFFLSGAFAVFIAVLVQQVMGGETSCGCFGGNIEIDPRVMLAIDGGLLAFLLATKPWSSLPRGSGLGAAALLPLFTVAAAAPYGKLQEVDLPIPPRKETPAFPKGDATAPATGAGGSVQATGTGAGVLEGVTGGTQDSALPEAGAAAAGGGTPETGTVHPETADPAGTVDPETPVASSGTELPEFRDLPIASWVGQDPWATEFAYFYSAGEAAGYTQLGAFQPNQHVIVYRQTCEHCKAHLEQVAQELQTGDPKWAGKNLLLLRLVETKDTPENNICTLLPSRAKSVLPAAQARLRHHGPVRLRPRRERAHQQPGGPASRVSVAHGKPASRVSVAHGKPASRVSVAHGKPASRVSVAHGKPAPRVSVAHGASSVADETRSGARPSRSAFISRRRRIRSRPGSSRPSRRARSCRRRPLRPRDRCLRTRSSPSGSRPPRGGP